MKLHVDAGDRVAFYFCGHDAPYKEGISVPPEECGLFRKLPEVRGVELIGKDRLKFVDRVQLPDISYQGPAEFDSLESLMQFKHGNFEAGVGVASSLVSNERNSRPDLVKNNASIRTMIESALRVYAFARATIEQERADLVYVFNGRFCNYRAVMSAGLDAGIEVLVHERGGTRDKYDVQPFMPHEAARFQEKIVSTWAKSKDDPGVRERGASYFIDRRAGMDPTWMSFTDQQKKDFLPAIDANKRVVTFFSSSEDEFVSVGGVFELTSWKSQYEAITELINICKRHPDIQLFIRLHPHLREKSHADQQRWLSLGNIENVTVISFDSEVDTYALIERSDVVVTAWSTVGIEAVFWGRPSITIGPSFYTALGATFQPRSVEELADLISADLVPADRDLAIAYGSYMGGYGTPFRYYEAEGLFNGKFMGIDLQAAPEARLRWLKLRQILTKPARLIKKLVNLI